MIGGRHSPRPSSVVSSGAGARVAERGGDPVIQGSPVTDQHPMHHQRPEETALISLGYVDQTHFTHAFWTVTDLTPDE